MLETLRHMTIIINYYLLSPLCLCILLKKALLTTVKISLMSPIDIKGGKS